MPNKSILVTAQGKAVTLGQLDDFMEWLVSGEGGETTEKDATRRVPWVFRAVQLRRQHVAGVPFAIMRGEREVTNSDDYEDPTGFLPRPGRLFGKIEASLTAVGRAYLFNSYNLVRTLDLRYLHPLSVEPKLDPVAGLTGWWRTVGGRRHEYDVDSIRYFWGDYDVFTEFGPPATSPVTAALKAAGVLVTVDDFAEAYSKRGMVKTTILTVPQGTGKGERERLRDWFKDVVTGIRNAFATEVLQSDAVTPVVIGDGLSELTDVTLTDDKRKEIATALGIPATILWSGEASGIGGGGVSKTDDVRLYRDTIMPEWEFIAEGFNEQVLKPLGLRIVDRREKLDVFKADETSRAQAFRGYVKPGKGVPVPVALEMLGVELPEGMEYEDLEDATLDPPQFPPQFGPPQQQPQQGEDEQEQPPPGKAAKNDAKKWRSVALRLHRRGQDPAGYDFESDHIEPEQTAAIKAALAQATTEEEVKAAFGAFFQGAPSPDSAWAGYP